MTCKSATFCLECDIGYRVNIATGVCVKCGVDIAGCNVCYYNTSSSQTYCIECRTGMYYNTVNNTCEYCPSNCTTCINSTNCVSC